MSNSKLEATLHGSAPWHMWFAWHPVRTRYHGWKWLTKVFRRQRWTPDVPGGSFAYWEYETYAVDVVCSQCQRPLTITRLGVTRCPCSARHVDVFPR